jgi:hypothetical protein
MSKARTPPEEFDDGSSLVFKALWLRCFDLAALAAAKPHEVRTPRAPP